VTAQQPQVLRMPFMPTSFCYPPCSLPPLAILQAGTGGPLSGGTASGGTPAFQGGGGGGAPAPAVAAAGKVRQARARASCCGRRPLSLLEQPRPPPALQSYILMLLSPCLPLPPPPRPLQAGAGSAKGPASVGKASRSAPTFQSVVVGGAPEVRQGRGPAVHDGAKASPGIDTVPFVDALTTQLTLNLIRRFPAQSLPPPFLNSLPSLGASTSGAARSGWVCAGGGRGGLAMPAISNPHPPFPHPALRRSGGHCKGSRLARAPAAAAPRPPRAPAAAAAAPQSALSAATRAPRARCGEGVPAAARAARAPAAAAGVRGAPPRARAR
jgi:hypothetical protein